MSQPSRENAQSPILWKADCSDDSGEFRAHLRNGVKDPLRRLLIPCLLSGAPAKTCHKIRSYCADHVIVNYVLRPFRLFGATAEMTTKRSATHFGAGRRQQHSGVAIGKLACACLHLLEQPHVLDRNAPTCAIVTTSGSVLEE